MSHVYLAEQQVTAIEGLRALKKVCDKHNIAFFLVAGTTLGAVRHTGMIPWDDDIDVGFLREDLEKLKKVITQELDNRFEYVSYETEPGFPRLFGKILYQRRSCVDLFLIARWTTKDFPGYLHWQITRFCVEGYYNALGYKKQKPPAPADDVNQTAMKRRISRRKIFRFFRKCAYKLLYSAKPEFFLNLARWNERYYETHGGDCYINLYSIYGMQKERILAKWVENPCLVTFEEDQYQTFGDTDAYLTHLYGDYMQLPPEEKRILNRHQETF